MQWNDGENAGFTGGIPWIKVNPNYKEINAETQVNDEGSVYHYYKNLIRLRKDYDVFVDGRFEMLLETDEDIFAYTRDGKSEQLFVICNFHDKTLECPLVEMWCKGKMLIGNYGDMSDSSILRPYEARIYLVEKKK